MFLAQILLGSLNDGDSSQMKRYRKCYAKYLSGTKKNMAEMFFEIEKPIPGKLWPHPLYQSKYYLWLSLWLEGKGRFKQAQEIAKSALDNRLGYTSYQRALKSLIKRVRK